MNVILYGDLKKKQKEKTNKDSPPLRINIKSREINTVYDLLNKLNIEENEVSHIFVNHIYCGPGKEIKEEDRIALFPRKMAVMFAEIPHSNSIKVTVKLPIDLRKYGPKESMIAIPEGSNIRKIIVQYNFAKLEEKLLTMINGIPCHDKKYVLKNGDIVRFKL